ncbi:MAG TPA: hypothetical protein VKJ00_07855, partial [Thermoanaerobaculia bacterium]|nr:hypothetical protein [Thermoanaerobaculia bacterium]
MPEATLTPVACAAAPETAPPPSVNGPLLRRADWRVLLPVPPQGFEQLILLGGPPGLAAKIVEIGLARRVREEIPGEPSADAVAILDGAGARPEDAASALLPGGCLYWEAESANALPNLRRSIERRLRRAGLFTTGLHAVLPDFQRSQLFVPLSAAVVRWHLSHWGPESLQRLLATPAGPAVAPLLTWRWRKHCAVTAVAWPRREAAPSILDHPALSAQSIEHTLVINREQKDATRRVIVFPFARGAGKPAMVLKFWRLAWRHPEVEREHETVSGLRSRLDPVTRRGIPEPLGTFRWGSAVVGAESCAPGRPLSQTPVHGRRSRIGNLALVTEWLLAFHRQTASRPTPWSESQAETFVDGPLAAYERVFGKRPEEGRLFDAVRKRSQSLLGRPLPLIQAHPDFSEL